MSALERLDVAETVGDIDLPCDAVRIHRGDAPATWVVWMVACCAARSPVGLMCDPCLQRWMAVERPIRCPDCGHQTPTARDWILRFEPIKPPAA